jgi:hypothetical protein
MHNTKVSMSNFLSRVRIEVLDCLISQCDELVIPRVKFAEGWNVKGEGEQLDILLEGTGGRNQLRDNLSDRFVFE